MDINNLLSSLGLNKKETLYVSISQAIGMEVFQIDENTGNLTKYANKHLDYDYSSKEIADLEKFRDAFLELTSELEIKPSCDIILNLPTVLLGTRELPTMLEDPAIGQSILAEIESSYIFSRYTPIFDWKDFDSSKNPGMRNIFYCALQDNVVSKITEIFKDLGARIIDIETSYTSILNGLARTNIIDKQLYPEKTWNLMIVNNGGYAIFSMVADKVVDFVQEEMTLLEERADDIYNSIVSTAELTLLGFPASSLVVVSETDMVNAEELTNSLVASGSLEFQELVFVDDNLYRKHEFLIPNETVDSKYKLKPSLCTLGMLRGQKYQTLARFDFIKIAQKVNTDNEIVRFIIANKIIEITPGQTKIYSIIICGVILALLMLLFIIFPILNKPYGAKISRLEEEIKQIDTELQEIRGSDDKPKFDTVQEIKNVLKNNRVKIISYKVIGEFIPKKVWVTYFKTYNKDKVIITGVSASIDDINKFQNDINMALPEYNLQLKNMEMQNDGNGDAAVAEAKYYNFIITNDDNYPPAPEEDNKDGKDNKNSKDNKSKKD